MAYPVTFDVLPPKEFDKAQVALRVVIVLVVHVLGISGIVFGGAYLIFPVLAAVMISQKGAQKYREEAQTGVVQWLRYVMMFYAYIALATDKLSTQDPEQVVKFEVRPTGSPTVGDALLRIILAIPHAIVLAFIGVAFFVVWIIAAISILTSNNYPDWAHGFMRGYLRWTARVLAYMAALVDEYPPFSFANGEASAPATPA